MTRVRSRSALSGVVLALVALFLAFGATAWHGAEFHDHVPVAASAHQVVDHQDPPAQDPDDADGAIHLAAHIVGQGLDLPGVAPALPALPVSAAVWSIVNVLPSTGLDPASLLRPPQA